MNTDQLEERAIEACLQILYMACAGDPEKMVNAALTILTSLILTANAGDREDTIAALNRALHVAAAGIDANDFQVRQH